MNKQHKNLKQVLNDAGCQLLTNWQGNWPLGSITHYTVILPDSRLRTIIVQEYPGNTCISTYIEDRGTTYFHTLEALTN